MKTIIVPLDLSDESLNRLNLAMMMTAKTGADILLVHVIVKNTSEQMEKENQLAQTKFEGILQKYKEEVSLKFTNSYVIIDAHKVPYTVDHLQGGNLTDMTLDYSHSIDADLISIMTEQEKSASNLLLGNFAHQMINKASIPVLSFPNYHLRVIAEDIWTLGAFNP